MSGSAGILARLRIFLETFFVLNVARSGPRRSAVRTFATSFDHGMRPIRGANKIEEEI